MIAILIVFWLLCAIFMYGVVLGDIGTVTQLQMVDYALAVAIALFGPLMLIAMLAIPRNFMNGFNHWRLK